MALPPPRSSASRYAPRPRQSFGVSGLAWSAVALGVLAFSVWWLLRSPVAPMAPAQASVASTTEPERAAAERADVLATTPIPSASPAGTPPACPLLSGARTAPPAGAYVSPNWYEGAGGYEAARRDHDMRSVPTFVYIFTDWCPYCRAFERDLLSDPEVERVLRDTLIKLRVNPEQSADQQALAERLGVHSFPKVFLLLDGEEPRPVSRQIERDGEAALRSPAEFVSELQRVRDALLTGRLRAARSLWESGDTPSAITVTDRLLALNPNLVAAHIERALAHDRAQATDDALDDLRRAYAIDGPQEAIFQTLDRVLERRQRWGESAACWTELLQQQPRNARALLGRATALARNGERTRAAADAREACALGEPQACALLHSVER